MRANYKKNANILKIIIQKNTRTKECKDTNIGIYYKNKKSSNIVTKNSVTSTKKDKLQMSNVIYKFNFPLPHSKVVSYIGMT